MSSPEERPELVAEVLSGGRRELQILAAEGLLPLPLGELIELQVTLSASSDESVAQLARRSLAELDPRSLGGVIGDGASAEVLSYLALHEPHPAVLEKVIRYPAVDHALLVQLAPRLEAEMQEILLLRQDAIIERPAILDALETNPDLTTYSERRIREYREHLLPTERRVVPPSAVELERAAAELTEEEVESAIEVAAQEPAKGQIEELTGLSEAQIRILPAPVRLKLSRGAPRMLRNILVRDANPLVATSVVLNNPITDGEAEEIAANRAVRSEVLQAVSTNRSWMRRYAIVRALVRNPRSPAALAIRLIPRLSLRDMQSVSRDHNVPHAVRAVASRLYKMRRQ